MRKKNYRMLRRPRTTNEKRSSQQCKYVRAKRRLKNLADAWDDQFIIETRCWKDKRKKQYREHSRGQCYEQIFDNSESKIVWDLETYFHNHHIPYSVKPLLIRKKRLVIQWYREVPSHKEEKVYEIDGKPWHTGIYAWVFKKIWVPKPIITEYNYYKQEGWQVNWWSDKDIGIEFLLRIKT